MKRFRDYLREQYFSRYDVNKNRMDDQHEMMRIRMSVKNYFCYQFGMPMNVFKKQEGALIYILFDRVTLRKLESFF